MLHHFPLDHFHPHRKLQPVRVSTSTAHRADLLDLRRRLPHHDWIRQVWEGCAGLHPAAEAGLVEDLSTSADPVLLDAGLLLASRRALQGLSNALPEALVACLLCFFLDSESPFDPSWAAGLLQNIEALRRLFLRLAERLVETEASARLRGFLRALVEAVNDQPDLTPALLVAVWLANPGDGLQTGLPLTERLRRAADFLAGRCPPSKALAWLGRILPPPESSPERQRLLRERPDPPGLLVTQRYPCLEAILFEGWNVDSGTRAGASRRRALARALASAAPDPSRPRTEADKTAIWQAYEELVACAAVNLSVVTSGKIKVK